MEGTRELQNRVAIVTGGSRGIGRSIVQELAKAGCSVVFTFVSNREASEEVLEDLKCEQVSAVQADVRDLAAAQKVVALASERYNGCSILVNNAGITRDHALSLMSEEDWAQVVETNLTGSFCYCRAVSSLFMRQQHGRIVNITSVSGIRGLAGQSNYCAAKAGMVGLTKALAKELGPYGITVNAVAPGYIETEMTTGLSEQHRGRMRRLTPLGRFGMPVEVARLVRFLASDNAGYITGQTIGIDGGIGI